MEVNSFLVPILNKIKFAERFKALSLKYNDFNNRIIDNNRSEILGILNSMGYRFRYNKSGDFFKFTETKGIFKFQINFVIQRGVVEIIWGVEKSKERLKIGGNINGAIEFLENIFIPKPVFSNYQDLTEILKEAFSIYEDFKDEVLKVEWDNTTE